jgi:hypothetical protein
MLRRLMRVVRNAFSLIPQSVVDMGERSFALEKNRRLRLGASQRLQVNVGGWSGTILRDDALGGFSGTILNDGCGAGS